MIAIIAVCAVLLQSPISPESAASVAPNGQTTPQPSETVAMDGDEMDRLIWYLYYGEWVSSGDEETSNDGEPASVVDNEAARKTSSK